MPHRFSRAEFYDLVWSEPLSTLAPRFGISGVALAKACRAAGIPVPERGHWARKRVDKPVRRRPLPPRSPGAPDSVVLGGGRWTGWSTGDDPSAPLPPPPAFEEDVPALIARVQAMLGKVSVPRALDRPHRLIAALLAEDEARREKRARAAYPSILDTPKFDTPIERRRLRILNGLFLALERAGSKPSLNRDGRDVRVQVGQSSVPIVLERTTSSTRKKPSARAQTAAETLDLTIAADGGSGHAWRDADGTPIEAHAGAIAVAIIVEGEVRHRRNTERLHAWLVERRAEREKAEQRRHEEAERRERDRQAAAQRARVERLLSDAAAHQQAGEIRSYVAAVRAAVAQTGQPVPVGRLEAWAEWALAEADRIDPLTSGRASPWSDEPSPS